MRFVKQTRIAASPLAVFAFHEAPGALERLTPPWERVRVVAGGDGITPGTRVVIETRIAGFPVEWVAVHTEYERGRFFADRQVSGPFARWRHRHWFLDDANGGTLLRDEVDYDLPLGLAGRWLGSAFVRCKLQAMFDYRHDQTRRLVEAPPTGAAGA